ncbi:hypothetical protein Ciccas_001950 [Cichlidogyrus casuarinus]|uniref:Uncharacterized protein n=1 Tax=Cichlidogyrus casuarinus TaxID=1844966 RepID=A0ABD2QIK6_9PLAT
MANTDDDSGQFSAGSSVRINQGNILGLGHPTLAKTQVNIVIFDLPNNGKVTYEIVGDCHISDLKLTILKKYSTYLIDAQNYALYIPPSCGKFGKYLEEERTLRDYISDSSDIDLEFVYKQRINFGQVDPLKSNLSPHLVRSAQRSIIKAIHSGNAKKVSKVLGKGLDPNFHCPFTSETPLTMAVLKNCSKEIFAELINGGAHKDFKNRDGNTPLHVAVIANKLSAVKDLLDFGQSPNCFNNDGLTPLFLAICNSRTDEKIINELLFNYADIGIIDIGGMQEIHHAAKIDVSTALNLLITYGADVNARCISEKPVDCASLNINKAFVIGGDTPLHVASRFSSFQAVTALLSRGADPRILNDYQESAISIAERNKDYLLAGTLKTYTGLQFSKYLYAPYLRSR